MVTDKKTILKITAPSTDEGFNAVIEAEYQIESANFLIKDKNGALLFSGDMSINHSKAEARGVFESEMWSLSSPVLYTFCADVKYKNGDTETICDRFGFRNFSCDENYIYLNGYPFYMRAYIRGAAAHEHQNNCGLSEHEFYKKNILMAKSYGFNTIRFHSVTPPRECFEMADEYGILIHIENRAKHMEYDNLSEMLHGKNELASNDELIETINNLYNHPSFMVYCIGNEIRKPGKTPRVREISQFIKQNDPTRLFIDTCAHGEYDRDYVDFDVQHMGYFFPYGKNLNMFSDTSNLLCFGTVHDRDMVKECGESKIKRAIAFKRPLIAHEVCHYTSWRDYYALKEKFQKYGIKAPWWVDEEIKMVEAKGYKENFADILQITKDNQFRCWKTALEGIRSSKLLSGFHMLQFADTDKYENSNGVVDCFDDYQGISPEAFKAFNDDTVVVARLNGQIYSSKQLVQIPVIFSQFKIAPPKSATLSFSLSGSKVYTQGNLTDVDTFQSAIYDLCTLDLVMPDLKTPEKLILKIDMSFCDGSSISNSWELWVFPEEKEVITLDAKNDMQADYLNYKCKFNSNSDLTITDKLDNSHFEKLQNGENVLLLYRTDWTRHLLHKGMTAPEYSFRHTWERFKGVIWDRGTFNGGYDKKEILNKYGFVTDGQTNFQYYKLIDDCDKINLDDFPVNVTSLVSGIDKPARDRFDPKFFKLPELMYDRTMRKFTYAFELRVGKGKLIVTGFNFTGINNNEPSSVAMLKTLVNYMHSEDFNPTAEISVCDLKAYLKKTAESGPQKERMMTQYWQLDAEPVESAEYWQESEAYLKEDL